MSSLSEQWKKSHSAHINECFLRIENAYKCLRIVKQNYPFSRVADFGCGIGAWLLAAQRHGATEIKGFEGDWIANSETVIPKDVIQLVDLAEEALQLNKYFDLAMTIEVAEHLPEFSADKFVSTLVSASDAILFSAAIPGQGGLGHINEQKMEYWVGKFWDRQYIPLEIIRPFISHDKSIFPWLRQNLIMFISYDLLLRYDSLRRYARPLNAFKLKYPIY